MAALEWVDIAGLKLMPGNPRGTHKLADLMVSLRHNGMAGTLTVNTTTEHVVGGNGRLQALRRMHKAKEQPPAGIKTHGKQWLAPVIYGTWPAEDEPRIALALNGGANHELEGAMDAATVAKFMASATELDLASLGVKELDRQQILLDYETPTIPPAINLDGIERIPAELRPESMSTLKMQVTEALAQTVRSLTARGVPIADILTKGTDHYQAARRAETERKASSATTAKADQATAGRKDRPRARNHPGNAKHR